MVTFGTSFKLPKSLPAFPLSTEILKGQCHRTEKLTNQHWIGFLIKRRVVIHSILHPLATSLVQKLNGMLRQEDKL